ncbi:MAG: FISUMP domain-containing protein, partial [Anaerolineales bacterium]
MKKLTTLIATAFITVGAFCQIPQKMSYQAVIRSSSDELVRSSTIGMQISILQGSESGNPVYVETLTSTTNINGLITIEIGGGVPVKGTFSDIDWSTGVYFLKTETDPTGGTSYSITGTSQLLSVPYALYAKTSESSSDAVKLTGDQTITGNKTFSGTTTVSTPVNATDAATKAYVDALLDEIHQMQAEMGVNDIDGNQYNAVKIGSQVWMNENLKTTKYSNGDIIGTTSPATLDISGESEPKYQWAYAGDEGNVSSLGRLYTWYAVNDSRNVCPEGWHVPSDAEWTTLSDYLTENGYGYEGSGGDIAKSLAATNSWIPNEVLGTPGNHLPSNNSSNFNALPAGLRNLSGLFDYLGTQGLWWSATELSESIGSNRIIYSGLDFLHKSTNLEKSYGFSVRCIKDLTSSASSDRYGLYTIKIGTDELYFIDLNTFSISKIANIGVVIPNMFT